ncbi:MAG: hypothetical protein LBB78_02720 [Spirochaetaceae bacterium]|nr:hypothetical protein [Spirochaetaceae bacterium]
MKRYFIKANGDRIEYFDILGENNNGYRIRLTKINDGYEKTIEDSMSRTLFDVCLKTGYIYELEEAASSVA